MEKDNIDLEKIKIFFSEDDKLKSIGELLSNDSSRKIMRCLIDDELYINEIAKKLGLGVSLVIHHLKKLEELGLLEITEKQITKKGNMHKFYKMIPNFFISPNADKKDIKEKRFLKKFFKESVKLLSVFLVGIFIVRFFKESKNSVSTPGTSIVVDITQSENLIDPTIPIIISLVIISIGVIVFLKKRKKMANHSD